MDVSQLNDEQFDFLRMDLFYNPENAGIVSGYSNFTEIPDELILDYYGGVCFVPEDFAN